MGSFNAAVYNGQTGTTFKATMKKVMKWHYSTSVAITFNNI